MTGYEMIKKKLKPLDNRDYGAYQSMVGEYEYPGFTLNIRQIPKDPYAPPHTGVYCIRLPQHKVLPGEISLDNNASDDIYGSKNAYELSIAQIKEIAFRDFIARRFFESCEKESKGRRGTGYSGVITIQEPGQCILARSSVILDNGEIEIRFFIGLPAEGRKIQRDLALEMLCTELPTIVASAFDTPGIDSILLDQHINTTIDAEFIRHHLKSLGLVAFIADNSLLPRTKGTSDKPLSKKDALLFTSPESMKTAIELPCSGQVTGMGIPEGVTLIVGGGYHGKSTLLKAIEEGIYNHIPGDGRELCVSRYNSVKIRAYSGRYAVKTDISAFIKDLPFDKDTVAFSTENASGSTSQATGIVESIEAGASVLLMDEDTCATNFMIRDAKMQQLVRKKDEPIAAFIDKVRQLYEELGMSTILVLGGVGDYFDVADYVIQMLRYLPVDVTSRAHDISRSSPMKRIREESRAHIAPRKRIPLAESVSPYNSYGKYAIYAKELYRISFGKEIIDVSDIEQLKELGQTKALAMAIDYSKKYMNGKRSIWEVVECVMADIRQTGLNVLSKKISGNLAGFRGLDLAFTLNRLRGFDVIQKY